MSYKNCIGLILFRFFLHIFIFPIFGHFCSGKMSFHFAFPHLFSIHCVCVRARWILMHSDEHEVLRWTMNILKTRETINIDWFSRFFRLYSKLIHYGSAFLPQSFTDAFKNFVNLRNKSPPIELNHQTADSRKSQHSFQRYGFCLCFAHINYVYTNR